MIEIIVRDGRMGRDPAFVTEEGGQILATFSANRPYNVGDKLPLPDGTVVEVIGLKEELATDSYRQTLFIGEVWGSGE